MGCGAEHLCFLPSQQYKSGINSTVTLLTARNSELFCSNRIIMTSHYSSTNLSKTSSMGN